jgi:enoyl-CoA hydratase/carnithine racemase
VLRAAGRSFCAGYDISTGAASKDPWRHDALKWHAHLAESLEFEMIPWYMRKPVIASVQGHALGGGCEISLFCDMTIAADDALFGEPEVRFSDVGPAIVMPWIVGYKKARELLYFGDMIDAKTALELGMVNRVVPLQELEAQTLKFARKLALISPEALYATKLAISRGADVAGFRNAMQAGLDMVAPLYAAKSEVGLKFTDITRKEGLGAALRWRRAQFDAVERGE